MFPVIGVRIITELSSPEDYHALKVTSYLTSGQDRLLPGTWQALISPPVLSPAQISGATNSILVARGHFGLDGPTRIYGSRNFQSLCLHSFGQTKITATIATHLTRRSGHQRRGHCDRHLKAAVRANVIADDCNSSFAARTHSVIIP